jgi:hypothetical protein
MEVDLAPIREQMYARTGQALGAGEDAGQGVLSPGATRTGVGTGVGVATPQVDHKITVDPHRDRCAYVAVVGEVALEG